MMLCGWGVKAGWLFHSWISVWVTGKTMLARAILSALETSFIILGAVQIYVFTFIRCSQFGQISGFTPGVEELTISLPKPAGM